MSKVVGSIIKALAYFFLFASIALGIYMGVQPRSFPLVYTLPFLPLLTPVAGFLLFLGVFAFGQMLASLVSIQEQQLLANDALTQVVSLLNNGQGAADSYGSSYEPTFSPTPFEEPAPQPTADWRRSQTSFSSAYAPSSRSVEEPPAPQVACSLCGTVQNAGRSHCQHCNASFVGA